MSLELHTEDRLVYQFYPVTSNSITFSIKAPHDAHIALTSTPYESNPMYEVFFGGWKNTKSVIRKNQQQPDVFEVQTPNILDANSFRKFWIRWEYGTITAGVENNSQPLMTWRDSESFPIQYFGVCTGWGAKGHWIIENSPPVSNSCFAGNCVPPPNASGFGYPTPGLYPPAPGATPGYIPPPVGPNVGFNPQAFNTPNPGAAPFVPPNAFGVPTNAPKWIPSSNGSIPPNAVIGGNDANGEQLFVVRAKHEGALIPGKLVPSHRVAYVAWGGRENPKSDYEVLCDCSPRWVPAFGQQIPPGAFPGGQTENGETLYIGRSQHEGSTTVGKVQISHGVCYIPFGGQEISKQQYEILTI